MDKSRFTLGGTAWINLLNTIEVSDKKVVDILLEPVKTLQWLEENNLLREEDVLALEHEELLYALTEELRTLRQLCKSILSELKQQKEISQDSVDQLNKLVKELNIRLTLAPENGVLRMIYEGVSTRDHVRYNIVSSITDTLESLSIDRIRECEHDECILHFIDTSKSGKRRWCSMELCGNRQKAADFYARKMNKK